MVLLLLFSLFSIAFAACPGNFTPLGQSGQCVLLNTQPDEFFSAEVTCRNLGGHLLSIHSGFENTLLLAMAIQGGLGGSGLHIGAYRQSNTTTWNWQDASNWTYSHWAPGQPSFDNTVELNINDGNWYTTDRDTLRPFFCGHAPTDGTKCDKDWVPYKGYCYNLNEYSTHTQDEAESVCGESNAHLVSIHSEDEEHFLLGLANTNCRNPAIGLSCGPTGIYSWSDGTDYTFNNNTDCFSVYSLTACGKKAGYWKGYDDGSTEFESFVCKKPGNK